MVGIPINTKYLKGEEYPLSDKILPDGRRLFKTLQDMEPYDRDRWCVEFLKLNNIEVLENNYVVLTIENNKVLRAKIVNTIYKPDVYLG